MYIKRHQVTITTNGSGDGTGYTEQINGRVLSVQYIKTDYIVGVDFTITAEKTGMAILSLENQNTSGLWYPRSQVHDAADGSALTLDGTRKNCEPVALAGERVKIVVASGGDTKTGKFYVTIG